jgi:NADPH2:quinone reductase
MRMIVVPRLGGPEVLTLVDGPMPVAASDQLLVRLDYALVGFADVYQREGVYRASKTLSTSEAPLKIGGGGAGTVVSVGAQVMGFAPGDRVIYGEQLGSYAEYVAVPAWRATKVPHGIDLKDVAGLPSQGATAHYLAHDTGKLAPGMTCLVHAAAGGVGHVLVQLAKHCGATVLATVGSPEKAAFVRDLGADRVILYRDEDFVAAVKSWGDGSGVDVAYDAVGPATLDKTIRCVRPRGLVVLYGNTSGLVESISPMALGNAGSLFFTRPRLANHMRNAAEAGKRMDDLLGAVGSARLRLALAATLPLEHAAEAHRLIESRATIGRVLLSVR